MRETAVHACEGMVVVVRWRFETTSSFEAVSSRSSFVLPYR
jgi:hypothetical protein